MTLPEALREALRLVGDIGCDHVTIEHRGVVIRQVRFTPDEHSVRGCNIQRRSRVASQEWFSAWTPAIDPHVPSFNIEVEFTVEDVTHDWQIL